MRYSRRAAGGDLIMCRLPFILAAMMTGMGAFWEMMQIDSMMTEVAVQSDSVFSADDIVIPSDLPVAEVTDAS
jgi:hypothetical protein